MSKSGLYTGKGDRGDTARLGGRQRISKSDALIEAVGTGDEASSAIGMARALTQDPVRKAALLTVQDHLWQLMSHLSATPDVRERYPGVSADDVAWLEQIIAQIEEDLPPLTGFVRPGETVTGAALHVARTAVRRLERRIIAFAEIEPSLRAENLAYVNRLSSLMFAMALREDAK